MSSLHREHHFEAAICEALAAQGWQYAEGDAAHYDRQNALFLPDLLEWLQATQPESLAKLTKTHGAALQKVLAERVRKTLFDRGTLEVLRRGVELLGLKQPLALAQFKRKHLPRPRKGERAGVRGNPGAAGPSPYPSGLQSPFFETKPVQNREPTPRFYCFAS